MNAEQVALLRVLLAGTSLEDDVVDFSAALGSAQQPAGGLLLVGTPDVEPWHFAAHLTDEAELAQRPELTPTLVRWHVPAAAPAHLAVGLDRIGRTPANETLLVVAPEAPPWQLLERVHDARRGGAVVMSIDHGASELRDVVHEGLTVPADDDAPYLDLVEHLVSAAAPGAVRRRLSVRSRLSRLLDRVQGAGDLSS
ncbi:MAG: hypothetical protein ABR520_05970 [Mycobacteriales bacterium]